METKTTVRNPGHSALRAGRISLSGQVYLVTFTTQDRHKLFADCGMAMTVSRAIADRRLWYRSRLLAWTLMPDHWHGLVELGSDDLSVCVQRLKTNTARILRNRYPETQAVWAKAFHDRAIRSDENLLDTARYIIANPIRAGLVQRVGQYPYWDAVWL